MKKPALGLLTVFSLTTLLQASPPELLTRPAPPNKEELRNLGLNRRWYAYVPMDGRRDRVLFAQAFGPQVVIQTASGAVAALNSETGASEWRTLVGNPYRASRAPAAANATSVYVVADTVLYCIDRRTGRLEWELRLPGVLSAPISVDDDFLFFSTNSGVVHAYVLPQGHERVRKLLQEQKGVTFLALRETKAGNSEQQRHHPFSLWSAQTGTTIPYPVVLTNDHAFIVDQAGTIYALRKLRRGLSDTRTSTAAAAVPLGQAGDTLIVSRSDSYIQALDVQIDQLVLRWRTNIGGLPLHEPIVIGPDLFVVAPETGLVCLDRNTGDRRWNTRGIKRFLATGPNVLLASGDRGRLILLDRKRGVRLGQWDASQYARCLTNRHTDRLFLVNHDGLVVCFHAWDLDQPVIHKTPVSPEEPPQVPTTDS